jgi:hypothetical protein
MDFGNFFEANLKLGKTSEKFVESLFIKLVYHSLIIISRARIGLSGAAVTLTSSDSNG